MADGNIRKMIIWVILIFAVAAGGSAYGVMRAMNTTNTESTEESTPQEELGPVFDAGVFTVDLVPDQRSRILRISVKLQTTSKQVAQQLDKRIHVVKDTIVVVLRNRTAASLTGAPGMDSLRQELIAALNKRLALDGGITDVYFPDMVMQ